MERLLRIEFFQMMVSKIEYFSILEILLLNGHDEDVKM